MRTRVILDILLFLAIFIAPIWFTAIVTLFGLFMFENYYEIIFLGVIADGLFGLPIGFLSVPAVYTILASFLFVTRTLLSKHLKFYA